MRGRRRIAAEIPQRLPEQGRATIGSGVRVPGCLLLFMLLGSLPGLYGGSAIVSNLRVGLLEEEVRRAGGYGRVDRGERRRV